ncbi:flagellar biosynthesis anti-sigma factor FlgM [Salirhabdus salicampi]|uniref:flagellar biosynthesis anti-sigma factor FlgM n=1 Tax=Salirhabdus salicampi TaxID=476102 RepID=UPI0020C37207|nr:flagellar biosynthesis anti-sigma factor FlgM [Salirhabdus salicampi]MCP8617595.1 flagellar biosynthesis anti-sigma factor FlgM [Salirhabdus salicampi]
MKVNGPNHIPYQSYKKQVGNQQVPASGKAAADKIEISSEAKKLLQNNPVQAARQEKVDAIKKAVQSGEYKVDPKATAEKMASFWSNKS